jgi:hypothetical protein
MQVFESQKKRKTFPFRGSSGEKKVKSQQDKKKIPF